MKPSASPPDWSLLPHNPVGFFELSNDFDRKTLKRKYNQLIRQYKPEKAPAEFQKIRAAYELLDGRLRYGASPAAPAKPSFEWEAAQSKSPTTKKPPTPKTDQAAELIEPLVAKVVEVPIYQRVETESPLKVFKELQQRQNKTPFDYFCMALLSDVVADDEMMFFKLLLTGLNKHPGEPGLSSLLYEYLQQDFEMKQIPGLLKTVAKVITDQSFYFLTEHLWDELLRVKNFQTFATTLSACESNLKDFRIEGQLAFYLHILPAAIFKADGQWLQSKYKFLDSHAREVPPTLELDFELVFQLFEYRRSMATDKNYSPEIHRAISDYFVLRGQKGDEAVIGLQSSYAQNPSYLLDAFGPDTPYNSQQLVVWDYVNDDVCQRRDLFAIVDPRQLRAKIFDLMDDLNRSEYALFDWKEDIRYRSMKLGPYAVAIIAPFILLGSLFSYNIVVIITILLAIALPIVVHFLYRPSDRYDDYIERRMQKRYFSDWRGRFVHLFEATQIHHGELSEALIDIVQHHSEKVGFAAWLCRFLPADAGLHLFASAARYMR